MHLYLANWRKLKIIESFSEYLSRLPDKERQQARKYVREEDRARCLTGLLLRRMAVRRHTGLTEPRFGADAYGKPYVENEEGFQFNVSHSGDWAVCVCGKCAVGVDVEQVVSLDWTEYRAFFSEKEQKWLDEAQEPLGVFYYLWTVREAFAKKEGLGIPLFDTGGKFCYDKEVLSEGGGGRIAAPEQMAVSFGGRSAFAYSFRYGDYRVSVCCDGEGAVHCETLDAAEQAYCLFSHPTGNST